jgi:hypothetical protein
MRYRRSSCQYQEMFGSLTFAVISRAPIAKIALFRKRMGWDFPWLSSFGGEFNYDFQATVDETHPEHNFQPDYYTLSPGLSVFLRDGAHIYHTYSTYARGLDLFLNTTTTSITRRLAARRMASRGWCSCATMTNIPRQIPERAHENRADRVVRMTRANRGTIPPHLS